MAGNTSNVASNQRGSGFRLFFPALIFAFNACLIKLEARSFTPSPFKWIPLFFRCSTLMRALSINNQPLETQTAFIEWFICIIFSFAFSSLWLINPETDTLIEGLILIASSATSVKPFIASSGWFIQIVRSSVNYDTFISSVLQRSNELIFNCSYLGASRTNPS